MTFITFRTKFVLHLGPKFLLRLRPLLHLGTFITFEASTGFSQCKELLKKTHMRAKLKLRMVPVKL